jgi:hypothetical protein
MRFAGLSALRCPDHLCNLNNFGEPRARKEDRAICIARSHVI